MDFRVYKIIAIFAGQKITIMNIGKFTRRDYIKANRKASREAEIETHTRPIRFNRVHKSKKVYDRKRIKAGDKRGLPFFMFPDRVASPRNLPTYRSIFIRRGPYDVFEHTTQMVRIFKPQRISDFTNRFVTFYQQLFDFADNGQLDMFLCRFACLFFYQIPEIVR